MSDQPILIREIPSQIINVGASFWPLNLNDFIQSVNEETDGVIRFAAELSNGNALPKGLICTSDGNISGIPASGTEGSYDVVITAENNSGIPLVTDFTLTIHAQIAIGEDDVFNTFKSKVWEALKDNLPIPEMDEILSRPISAVEIYYLLQRFAALTIWDVYNLELPSEKKILTLADSSKHYNIYDRGSCLVAAPKDLFSHERTLEDALMASRALAREAYRRGWTIELAGFNKMIRAAWVELQHLGDKYGKYIDILRYDPSSDDLRVYTAQAKVFGNSTPGLSG